MVVSQPELWRLLSTHRISVSVLAAARWCLNSSKPNWNCCAIKIYAFNIRLCVWYAFEYDWVKSIQTLFICKWMSFLVIIQMYWNFSSQCWRYLSMASSSCHRSHFQWNLNQKEKYVSIMPVLSQLNICKLRILIIVFERLCRTISNWENDDV